MTVIHGRDCTKFYGLNEKFTIKIFILEEFIK